MDNKTDSLAYDLIRIGPAPTRQREVAVMVITVALLAVLLLFLDVTVVGVVAAFVLLAAIFGVRWAVGTRRWSTS